MLDLSFEFVDFVDYCLTWDDVLRPTSESLLKHPFLTKTEFRTIRSIIQIKPPAFKLVIQFRKHEGVKLLMESLKKHLASSIAVDEMYEQSGIKTFVPEV